jgi:hypothetical protein
VHKGTLKLAATSRFTFSADCSDDVTTWQKRPDGYQGSFIHGVLMCVGLSVFERRIGKGL